MSRLVLVAGARPNFMKVAPILRELERREHSIPCDLVHTGQHYDKAMSEIFFAQLGIRTPDAHLEIGSASHGIQTGKLMIAFEEFLVSRDEPPAGVVVVGDVNSTIACALVAAKRGVPVAHVEAGLRSFDRSMPEEINRVLTDAISDLLLVSEPAGLENLAEEGVSPQRLRYVGNVMIDSLVHQLPAAIASDAPAQFGVERSTYVVVTLHRPSNVDDPERLAALVDLLLRLGERVPILFPVHPRTDKALRASGLRERLSQRDEIQLLDPIGYRELLGLQEAARLVVTDSGGIQEETTFLGVPCITLRPNTERPITVTEGTNRAVTEDVGVAWQAIERVLADDRDPDAPPPSIDGWDGRAAERIVDALLEAWA